MKKPGRIFTPAIQYHMDVPSVLHEQSHGILSRQES